MSRITNLINFITKNNILLYRSMCQFRQSKNDISSKVTRARFHTIVVFPRETPRQHKKHTHIPGNGNSLSHEMLLPAGRRLSFKAADSVVGTEEGTRLSRLPRVGVFLSNCASTRPSSSQWQSEWQPMDLPGRGARRKEMPRGGKRYAAATVPSQA